MALSPRVLKDAVQCLASLGGSGRDTHYIMGSALQDPIAFPGCVRLSGSVIGREAQRQFAEQMQVPCQML